MAEGAPLVTTPDWLAVSAASAAIVLAVLAVVLMFGRAKAMPGDDADSQRPLYVDPVLIASAAGVVVLATVAWFTR